MSIVLLVIISPTHTDANASLHLNKEPLEKVHIQKVQLYDELKSTNKGKRLFFDHKKLNLSGLTLLSLLADLGIREHPILTHHEMADIDATDEALTLELYHIASQSYGNQLKSAANKPADFRAALINDTLPAYIDSAMPQFNAVIRLRQAINKYKRIKNIAWPALSDTFNPQLGQGHAEVKILRKKLVTLNDLQTASTSKHRLHIFDQSIINGLKHFQRRNGLKPTGRLNPKTQNALNQNIHTRINKLQVNLWRWLSLPRIPPTKYIMVNIPAFDLALIDKGVPVMDMKVIVGKPSNQTPIMITEVNSVTLNPTWTPTRNIINKDLLPLHNKNNTALKSLNFYLAKGYGSNTLYREVPPNLQEMLKQYRLVQQPGSNNALGNVRFNIKNNNAIFLHDTPTKYLFKQHNRALSHGCIRLEKPDDLLTTLRIKHRKNNSVTKHLRLQESLPVFITYQTAWIDNLGKINWRNDLYNKDK
ncbi:L,D-transpeptidase family protein [Moritella sp.]|uniref:L,D-transpeptidase family protein n=1 Tax=Moritella sp. TaxID=78556 RepID=UPI0025FB2372|nr:L,D-transpeptidase family protein [Moritella sp.]